MYPKAVQSGMSKFEFYHSTIKDVNIFLYAHQKEYSESIKMEEYKAWLYGMYVQAAIGSAFSKSYKYPENPLTKTDTRSISERTGKSEVELNQQLVMATMMIRQANANIHDELEKKKMKESEDE